MFYACKSLEYIDLSNCKPPKNYNIGGGVFTGCKSLNHIKCSTAFRDWMWTVQNADKYFLPEAMWEGGTGIWELTD